MKTHELTCASALVLLFGAAGCHPYPCGKPMPENITEQVIETIKHDGAVFEIVERPEMVYAGKAYYTTSTPPDKGEFHTMTNDDEIQKALDSVLKFHPSTGRVHISVDFGKPHPERLGFVFAKETETKNQPEGVDVFVMPASLFIRGYSNSDTARLMGKTECQPWELFAFMRYEIMPKHGYKMAENGAQEMEYFDNAERTRGYAYIPVVRMESKE